MAISQNLGTLAVTILAVVAAFTARETDRIHMHGLGNPRAQRVPKRGYVLLLSVTVANSRSFRVFT